MGRVPAISPLQIESIARLARQGDYDQNRRDT